MDGIDVLSFNVDDFRPTRDKPSNRSTDRLEFTSVDWTSLASVTDNCINQRQSNDEDGSATQTACHDDLKQNNVDCLSSDIEALSLNDMKSSSLSSQLLSRGPIHGQPTSWASNARDAATITGNNSCDASYKFPWPKMFPAINSSTVMTAAPHHAIAMQPNKRKSQPVDNEASLQQFGSNELHQLLASLVPIQQLPAFNIKHPLEADKQAIKFKRCLSPQQDLSQENVALFEPIGIYDDYKPSVDTHWSHITNANDEILDELLEELKKNSQFDNLPDCFASSATPTSCNVSDQTVQQVHINPHNKLPPFTDQLDDIFVAADLNGAAELLGMAKYKISDDAWLSCKPVSCIATHELRRGPNIATLQQQQPSQQHLELPWLIQKPDLRAMFAFSQELDGASSASGFHTALMQDPSAAVQSSDNCISGPYTCTFNASDWLTSSRPSLDDINSSSYTPVMSPVDSGFADICSQPSPTSPARSKNMAASFPPPAEPSSYGEYGRSIVDVEVAPTSSSSSPDQFIYAASNSTFQQQTPDTICNVLPGYALSSTLTNALDASNHDSLWISGPVSDDGYGYHQSAACSMASNQQLTDPFQPGHLVDNYMRVSFKEDPSAEPDGMQITADSMTSDLGRKNNAADKVAMMERLRLAKASSIVARKTRNELLATDDNGNTMLHRALIDGQAYVAQALLYRFARELLTSRIINQRNHSNETPLWLAASRGLARVVGILVSMNANVDAQVYERVTTAPSRMSSMTSTAQPTCGVIHYLASGNAGAASLPVLIELLKAPNIDLFALDSAGRSALHRAVESHGRKVMFDEGSRANHTIDSKEIIRQLVLRGADINQRDEVQGKTVLHWAVDRVMTSGSIDLVRHLLDVQEETNRCGSNAQYAAVIGRGVFDDAQRQVTRQKPIAAVVNELSGDGSGTILHAVALADSQDDEFSSCHLSGTEADRCRGDAVDRVTLRTQLIELLLSRGADPNAKNTMGKTPAQMARRREIISMLLWERFNSNTIAT